MIDDQSARLALPYVAGGQAQKHVTVNETFTRLDGLVQTVVESRSMAVAPANPAEGALYIVPNPAGGAGWPEFTTQALVRFEAGGWTLVNADEGFRAWVRDERQMLVRIGAGWAELTASVSRMGIGTAADATTPLAAKLNAALFTARSPNEGGTGSLRLTLNKTAPIDTASLVWQNAYSGRAELGLTGNEDLNLKVSADGANWATALIVDRRTGLATVRGDPGSALGIATKGFVEQTIAAGRVQLDTVIASGSYSPPAWARRLRIIAIGAGGSGGSGSNGPVGSDRPGGGGGAPGSRVEESYLIGELALPLSITIGGAAGGGQKGGDTMVSDATGPVLVASGGLAGVSTGQSGHAGLAGSTGPGGGGGGGSVDAAGQPRTGGQGGLGYSLGGTDTTPGRRASGGRAGAIGQAGAAGLAKAWRGGAGSGGGGGGAGLNGGAAGGAGGTPGGGGGGGGACTTGQTGAGGSGGRGEVWILALG